MSRGQRAEDPGGLARRVGVPPRSKRKLKPYPTKPGEKGVYLIWKRPEQKQHAAQHRRAS